MKYRGFALIFSLSLAILIIFGGCGDSGGGSTNPPGSQGDYEIVAGFLDSANQGKPGISFTAIIKRLDSSADPASSATIDVDGTIIPLTAGTDDQATYQSSAVTYTEGNSYEVDIEIGDQSASSTIIAPAACTVTIETPADNSTFTPGEATTITWGYSDKAVPPECFLEVNAGSTELIDLEFTGSTTSYTIPASTTNSWTDHEEISILVGAGVTQTITGDMVTSESESFVLLSTDTISLDQEHIGQVGEYFLAALFAVEESGTSISAMISVDRQNSVDAPADEAVVTINGTTIPLMLGSTADEAFYMDDISYQINQNFNVSVTVGGETATASFTGWDRHGTVSITSPQTMSTFTPGTDIDLVWEYDGATPDEITVAAAGTDVDDATIQLWPYTVAATATSVTMTTSEWAGCEQVAAAVESSSSFEWSGDIVASGSTGSIIYMMDLVILLSDTNPYPED